MIRSPRIAVALIAAALLAGGLAACGGDDNDPIQTATPTTLPGTIGPPPIDVAGRTTASGLQIFDVIAGEGEAVRPGDAAAVHYAGWLEDGTLFDTSLDGDAKPFTFPLGAGQVIDGWEEGVVGMQPGSVRRLIIPPELAYGDEGFGDSIPPNAILTFDIELIAIGRPTTDEAVDATPEATP